jgi:hypothetical protein
MKYPAHTNSTPVLGKQAERVIKSVDMGETIMSAQYAETIQRIINAKKVKSQEATNGAIHSKIHEH